MLTDFDSLVQMVLNAPKIGDRRYRWRRTRADYVSATIRLRADGLDRHPVRLEMTAHLHLIPRKLGFNLMLYNKSIIRLDVEPRRSHRNILTKRSVNCTHWQTWPIFEAEPDDRSLPHRVWLDEFCNRSHIHLRAPYRQPPFDRVQWELSL